MSFVKSTAEHLSCKVDYWGENDHMWIPQTYKFTYTNELHKSIFKLKKTTITIVFLKQRTWNHYHKDNPSGWFIRDMVWLSKGVGGVKMGVIASHLVVTSLKNHKTHIIEKVNLEMLSKSQNYDRRYFEEVPFIIRVRLIRSLSFSHVWHGVLSELEIEVVKLPEVFDRMYIFWMHKQRKH